MHWPFRLCQCLLIGWAPEGLTLTFTIIHSKWCECFIYFYNSFIHLKLFLLYFSLPWDQSTLFGYVLEMFVVIYEGQTYMISNGVFLLFFISICCHHQAFYRMFKHSMTKLDHHDANRNDKRFLCDVIRFHASVRE